MSAFLMKLLNMSLTATVVLAVILLLRALLKNRIPRWGISLLWLVAALALVVPFRPVSSFSIWKTTDLLLSVSSVISDVQTTEQEIDLRHSEEIFNVAGKQVSRYSRRRISSSRTAAYRLTRRVAVSVLPIVEYGRYCYGNLCRDSVCADQAPRCCVCSVCRGRISV